MTIIDEPIFESKGNKNQKEHDFDLPNKIRQLVESQLFCILSTQGKNQPYGSLVAYAFTENLKHFFFKTHVATRKYKLLQECPQVALVIDSRSQHLEDMTRVEAVTITGKTSQLQSGEEYILGINLLGERHPYLADFIKSESTALFRIDVVRYFHVMRFQEVSQWIP